jgi:hypothetical protein
LTLLVDSCLCDIQEGCRTIRMTTCMAYAASVILQGPPNRTRNCASDTPPADIGLVRVCVCVCLLLLHLQDIREQHLSPVFQQLQQWAAATAPALQQHPSGAHAASSSIAAAAAAGSSSQSLHAAAVAGPGGATAADLRQLPTAVLSVASSSTTAGTYAHLIATLKKQVCVPCCERPRDDA